MERLNPIDMLSLEVEEIHGGECMVYFKNRLEPGGLGGFIFGKFQKGLLQFFKESKKLSQIQEGLTVSSAGLDPDSCNKGQGGLNWGG